MVTCPKCGTQNADDSRFCTNCGVALYSDQGEKRRGDNCFGQPQRHVQDECFGLPHGGTIVGLFIGLIIIIYGLTSLFRLNVDLGPLFVIMFGVLIVAGALYAYTRRR